MLVKKTAAVSNNAVIMFSLIGNVEYISFTLDDGLEPYSIRYTREWANNQWGKDVRDFAKSEEEFSKLIDAAYGIGKNEINCKKGLGKFLDFQIVCMQDKATFSFRPAFSLSGTIYFEQCAVFL